MISLGTVGNDADACLISNSGVGREDYVPPTRNYLKLPAYAYEHKQTQFLGSRFNRVPQLSAAISLCL